MATKAFLLQPTLQGYQQDTGMFRMVITYDIYGDDNGPTHDNGSFIMDVPPGSNPYQVYSTVYQNIVDRTGNVQFPTVLTKNDVFGYIPTPFTVLLPDLPTFG